jgi:hypothetical protein
MPPIFLNDKLFNWSQVQDIQNKSFICGYCDLNVASNRGYKLIGIDNIEIGGIYLCPNCLAPSFFISDFQCPSFKVGHTVQYVPQEVNILYEEARLCASHRCYTAAVMLCRKILMNIAVDRGAKEGKRFVQYVDFLFDQNYIPPNGKQWVGHIKDKGNEANHEIKPIDADDARELLIFTEMLLKFIYELPSMISNPAK